MIICLCLLAIAATDTTKYVVLNHGRPAGDMIVVQRGDSVLLHYEYRDRNRGFHAENRYHILRGAMVGAEARVLPLEQESPIPDASDRFEIAADSVRHSGRGGATSTRIDPGTYYGLQSSTPFDQAVLARFLLRQPGHAAKFGDGRAVRLEIANETTVPTSTGRQRVRLALIHAGTDGTPSAIWLDSRDELFASDVAWFITVRAGAESALPALRAIETSYRDAEAEALAKRLTRPPSSAIAIVNGDVFDSERGVMRPHMTVVVNKDRIVSVGPADSVRPPAGAVVIDAAGKTIIPGLWDMHGHLQFTSQNTLSVAQLSFGLTTVRDLASDLDVAVSQRDRAATGRILAPRAILAGFIEGPGKWAGPTEVLVRTEDEARRWVARYDSMGYKQIKVYNLVHPDLIPTIAAEAHKRGMRLSGHIPRGLTVPDAVLLGFDEIQHGAFLFSTFFQDSLYVPTMRAYSAVATVVAPNVNVDGADFTQMIELLKQHGTVIDGTFSVWVGTNPTGTSVTGGAASSNIAKADSNYLRLIKRLYDAGVTMVPGTDNPVGTTYNNEVEVYERAGIPAAQVLQMATIVSARVMRDDRDYGSIAVGKVADLIIVDGKPAEHVADLRKVQQVMRAGRVYNVRELRKAAGVP
jgi:imidazolonepropionase-like amidohydrolase